MTSFTPVITTAISAAGGGSAASMAWTPRVVRPVRARSVQAIGRPVRRCSVPTRWPATLCAWSATPTPAADESPAISSRSGASALADDALARAGRLGQHRRAAPRRDRLRDQQRRERELDARAPAAGCGSTARDRDQKRAKSGLRLSKKALNASLASGLCRRSPKTLPSAAIVSSSSGARWRRISRLVSRTAPGGSALKRSATRRACLTTSPAGSTASRCRTRPPRRR